MARRELRDPIHGFVSRGESEEAIINAPVFQRLRRIRQLALASLVYPGATHTRFDHSIGAMHVAGKIASTIGLDKDDVRLVRLAALLHDLGHGPFSHASEPVLEELYDREKVLVEGKRQIHEMLTEAVIKEDESLGYVLSDRERERIIGILNGSYGESVLKGIVSGPLDADKQDYLLRDSYACGVRYGVYDIDRLSQTLEVHRDSEDRYLALNEDGVNALEQFVLAKYYMTVQVYRHRIRRISDAMIERALELGIREDRISWLRTLYAFDGSEEHVREYKTWTDDRLVNEILYGSTPPGYAKELFTRLIERRLLKEIASYRIEEFSDPSARHVLADLTPPARRRLEAEIGRYLNVDRNLVAVRPLDDQVGPRAVEKLRGLRPRADRRRPEGLRGGLGALSLDRRGDQGAVDPRVRTGGVRRRTAEETAQGTAQERALRADGALFQERATRGGGLSI